MTMKEFTKRLCVGTATVIRFRKSTGAGLWGRSKKGQLMVIFDEKDVDTFKKWYGRDTGSDKSHRASAKQMAQRAKMAQGVSVTSRSQEAAVQKGVMQKTKDPIVDALRALVRDCELRMKMSEAVIKWCEYNGTQNVPQEIIPFIERKMIELIKAGVYPHFSKDESDIRKEYVMQIVREVRRWYEANIA